MVVECPQCRARYSLDPARLRGGRGRIQCARCKNVFPVTAADDIESASDERATPASAVGSPGTRRAALSAASKGQRALVVGLVALPPGPFRQVVVGCLARAGVRCVSLDDGAEALDVARRSRPALVVAHAALRHLTGPELFEELRCDPRLAATRLVIVGGPAVGGRHPLDPAAVFGADAHLPEDATLADVERVVTPLLGHGSGERAADDAATDEREERIAEIDRWARVAADDLLAREAHAVRAALAADRREGLEPWLSPLLGAALEAFPSASAARREATLRRVERVIREAVSSG